MATCLPRNRKVLSLIHSTEKEKRGDKDLLTQTGKIYKTTRWSEAHMGQMMAFNSTTCKRAESTRVTKILSILLQRYVSP